MNYRWRKFTDNSQKYLFLLQVFLGSPFIINSSKYSKNEDIEIVLRKKKRRQVQNNPKYIHMNRNFWVVKINEPHQIAIEWIKRCDADSHSFIHDEFWEHGSSELFGIRKLVICQLKIVSDFIRTIHIWYPSLHNGWRHLIWAIQSVWKGYSWTLWHRQCEFNRAVWVALHFALKKCMEKIRVY